MDKLNPLKEFIRVILKKLDFFEKNNAVCCGATIAQSQAIHEIGLCQEITLNELAEALNLDKSTMSRTVNNLVAQGFAERVADSSDRRYVKIKLTAQGHQVFLGIDSALDLYFHSILAKVPKNKQKQVIESLWLLVDSVNQNECC